MTEIKKVNRLDTLFTVLTIVFLSIALVLLLFMTNADAFASSTEESVPISYTPSYTTQYAMSVHTGLTLPSDGSPTTLTILVKSWSDFPTDKKLHYELAGSNTLELTNGSNTIGMTVKNGDETVVPGDEIVAMSIGTTSSDSSTTLAMLTVSPDEKPTTSGTYSGNLTVTFRVQ